MNIKLSVIALLCSSIWAGSVSANIIKMNKGTSMRDMVMTDRGLDTQRPGRAKIAVVKHDMTNKKHMMHRGQETHGGLMTRMR